MKPSVPNPMPSNLSPYNTWETETLVANISDAKRRMSEYKPSERDGFYKLMQKRVKMMTLVLATR